MSDEINRLKEIEDDLRDIFEAALEARDAAQKVLSLRQALSMKLTKMQIEIQEAQLAATKTQ